MDSSSYQQEHEGTPLCLSDEELQTQHPQKGYTYRRKPNPWMGCFWICVYLLCLLIEKPKRIPGGDDGVCREMWELNGVTKCVPEARTPPTFTELLCSAALFVAFCLWSYVAFHLFYYLLEIFLRLHQSPERCWAWLGRQLKHLEYKWHSSGGEEEPLLSQNHTQRSLEPYVFVEYPADASLAN